MPSPCQSTAVSRTDHRVIELPAQMDNLVEQARAFAAIKHYGQIDRDGKPHTDHCERVAASLEGDAVLQAAALLHDVLEDTDCTAAEVEYRFGVDVSSLVILLTRSKTQSFGDYLKQIVGHDRRRYPARIHRMACMLKIADIQDNLNRCDAKMAPKRPMYESGLSLLKINL